MISGKLVWGTLSQYLLLLQNFVHYGHWGCCSEAGKFSEIWGLEVEGDPSFLLPLLLAVFTPRLYSLLHLITKSFSLIICVIQWFALAEDWDGNVAQYNRSFLWCNSLHHTVDSSDKARGCLHWLTDPERLLKVLIIGTVFSLEQSRLFRFRLR